MKIKKYLENGERERIRAALATLTDLQLDAAVRFRVTQIEHELCEKPRERDFDQP